MGTFITIDPDKNFWDLNPMFKKLSAASKVYLSDKDKKKNKSSSIMWSIVALKDYDSVYINLPQEERLARVVIDYGLTEDDLRPFEDVLDEYDLLQRHAPKRSIAVIDDKINQRNRFLESIDYDVDTAELIEKMLKNSAEIVKEREEVYKIVEKKQQEEKEGGSSGSVIAEVLEMQKKISDRNEKNNNQTGNKRITRVPQRDDFIAGLYDGELD